MPNPLRLTRALVDRLPATIPDPGPIAEIVELQTPEARAAALDATIASRPDPDAFWLFAFGSLMWRPDFEFAESRTARASGWKRAFCLGPDTRYRGNPDHPGLMLSLDRGGSCDGIAYRLDEDRLHETLAAIIAREPPIPPEWIRAETENGPIDALAFVSIPDGPGYVGGLSDEEIARQIAPAVGMLGSMADYVLNTALHLHELQIHDPVVWRIQDLIARELEKLPPRAAD